MAVLAKHYETTLDDDGGGGRSTTTMPGTAEGEVVCPSPPVGSLPSVPAEGEEPVELTVEEATWCRCQDPYPKP